MQIEFGCKILPILALVAAIVIFSGCSIPSNPVCGNNVCESPFESKLTCPEDCGATPACNESTTNTCVIQQGRPAVLTTKTLSNCDTVKSGTWCEFGCENGACKQSAGIAGSEFKLVKAANGKKITLAYISSDLDINFLSDLASVTFGPANPNGLVNFPPFSEYLGSFEVMALKVPSDFKQEDTLSIVNNYSEKKNRAAIIPIYVSKTDICTNPHASIPGLDAQFNEIYMPLCNLDLADPYVTVNVSRSLVHEFGHAFGLLADEYPGESFYPYQVDSPNIDSEGCPKWCSGKLNTNSPNYASYVDLNKNCIAPHINELGLLEIPDSTRKQFDNCLGNYPEYYNWDLGENCTTKTGCFFSASGIMEWRSQQNTIMRSPTEPNTTYGVVSENAMRGKLQSLLGI
ncbi:Uncharacterised protein [uncultured archaeon]|nr:Uncharacterised protein [uncultured archaeon]